MKKYFLIIVAFLIFGSVTSCKSVKTKITHTEKHSFSEQARDTFVMVKTERITDTLFVKVPVIQTIKQECDSLCQKELEKVLSQLSVRKQSGENKAGIYYDQLQRQLVLYQDLQEQFDTYKSNNQQQIRAVEIEKIKEIPVKYIPKLVMYLAVFGALSLLVVVVYFGKKIRKIKIV